MPCLNALLLTLALAAPVAFTDAECGFAVPAGWVETAPEDMPEGVEGFYTRKLGDTEAYLAEMQYDSDVEASVKLYDDRHPVRTASMLGDRPAVQLDFAIQGEHNRIWIAPGKGHSVVLLARYRANQVESDLEAIRGGFHWKQAPAPVPKSDDD
jgi:hypothetical protein